MTTTFAAPPRLGSHTIEDALTAADGDPEHALALVLSLIHRGLLTADKHGLHIGEIPELRAAA